MNIKNKAFTLVELIVVITILAILGTIAFISLQGYAVSARDATRVSDINNIGKTLELYILKTNKYPEPTDGISVTYSGATVWIQGTVGKSVLENVNKLSNIPLDPLLGIEYVYSVTENKKEFEIGSISEGTLLGSNMLTDITYAANEQIAFIKGTYNGVLAKTSTGNLTYVFALPSIITSDLGDPRVIEILEKKALVYNGYSNLPASVSNLTTGTGGFNYGGIGNNMLVYTGNTSTLFQNVGERIKLLKGLQDAYSGSLLIGEGIISQIVNTVVDELSPSSEAEELAWNIINNAFHLNIPIIHTSTSTNTICIDSETPTDAQYFTFDEGTKTITNYDQIGGGLSVVIPCKINGVDVVNIWGTASYGAFYGKGLISVVIPDSVLDIQMDAFGDNSITNLILPNNIEKIGPYAFSYNSITTISIPDSIVEMGFRAFDENPLTTVINYDGIQSSEYIYSPYEGGIELNVYLGSSTNLDIPSSINGKTVKSIGESVFQNIGLLDINIPSSVVNIGVGSFSYNSLTGITIPNTVESIGDYAFSDNELSSIVIPNSITSIGYGVFEYNSLTSLVIPDNIINIGNSTFRSNDLTSVTIGNNVESIGDLAFANNGLTSVNIPTSITSMGDNPFQFQNSSAGNGTVTFGLQSTHDIYYNSTYFDTAKLPFVIIE